MAWTKSAGYPKETIDRKGKRIVDQYYNTTSNTDGLPEVGDRYDIDTQYFCQSIQIDPDESGGLWYATVNYGLPTTNFNNIQEDNDPIYTLQSSTIETPLERNKNYKANWNNKLAVRSDSSWTDANPPAYWATATDTALTAEEAETVRWVKDDVPPTDTGNKYWRIIKDKQKQYTEAYLVASSIVEEQRWCKDRYSAQRWAEFTGQRVTPPQTFGVSGGEWLQMSATVQPDGDRWLLTRSFQHAPDWDSDIYD